MFFGVNIGPVQHRLGISINKNRETNRSDDQRNRARSKYGIPFISRWKVEVQNLSREISWQDLKDFCFNKTGVRPSRADINVAERIGTLCCPSEREMKSVLVKLHGVFLKGKPLRTVDVSDSKDSDTSRCEGRTSNRRATDRHQPDRHQTDRHQTDRHQPDRHQTDRHQTDRHQTDRHQTDRRQTDRRQTDRPRSVPHRSDRHKIEHNKSDHHSSDRHRSERKRTGHASSRRNLDEPKVIIHQPNGDRVITERVGNCDEFNTGDDGHISDNEQTYFKRDQRSSRSGDQGGSRGGVEVRTKRRFHIIDKYGKPHRTKWRIRVENLSSEVSWQDLKDIIRPYADVRYADAHKPVEGIGNVHVSTEDALHNVINKMNNSDLKGMIARFINDSVRELSVESVEPEKRARSRSPHRRRRSKSVGSDTVKKSRSK